MLHLAPPHATLQPIALLCKPIYPHYPHLTSCLCNSLVPSPPTIRRTTSSPHPHHTTTLSTPSPDTYTTSTHHSPHHLLPPLHPPLLICNHYKSPTSPPRPTACLCNQFGTTSSTSLCDHTSGQCPCKLTIDGRDCSTCQQGFFSFPTQFGDQVFKLTILIH